jgi:methylmalonyl-CoA mutase
MGTKAKAATTVEALAEELDGLQDLFLADRRFKMLVILQGTDTSGKDGTIRGVFGRMSALGVHTVGWKAPHAAELAHDYLWRIHQQVPAAGEVTVFNRSHYEDVLVPVVNGWITAAQTRQRYAHINDFERLLSETGTVILKFMLHISFEEQGRRLQERLDDPSKHWKFSLGDLMTDLSAESKALADYRPTHKVRFVTAASLFDGHDAAINIMRRILQGMGAEVIHLGHNRSVDEVVTAALQEDVQGIAISSYQGGHVEYFKYMVDLLRQRGGAHIQVFGGGGGVIVPPEIRELHAYGVARIFSPEDGQRMGLAGMIGEMVMRCDKDLTGFAPTSVEAIQGHGEMQWRALAQLITALENEKAAGEAKGAPGAEFTALVADIRARAANCKAPVLGITGTGGAGKSSLTDELIRRLRLDQGDRLRVAVISIDPSRRKSGGALLGDRIRMNAIAPWGRTGEQRVFMRSLATRDFGSEISAALPDVIAACKCAGFDLIVVETSGIGQGDAAIVPHVDVPLYVMTPEFGAASQLEKIDMLDFAEFVAINKFDRKGALDALRDVAKQVQRNKEAWTTPADQMPVFGTMAARFNDDGVTALYQALLPRLQALGLQAEPGSLPRVAVRHSTNQTPVVPAARTRYLAEISDTVRGYKARARGQATIAREIQQLRASARMLTAANPDKVRAVEAVTGLAEDRETLLGAPERKLLAQWPEMRKAYAGDEYVVKIRGKEIRTQLVTRSLSGTPIRKVSLPQYEDHGEILKWLMLDNVPGSYPYTAGTFAFKRENEDPTRMFAGEGDRSAPTPASSC